VLLKHGADLQAKNKKGHTPLDIAPNADTYCALHKVWARLLPPPSALASRC
jgi:ankyrin repeat protein